jgi:hypothetical protein
MQRARNVLEDKLKTHNMDEEHFPFLGNVARAKIWLLVDSGYSFNTHIRADVEIPHAVLSAFSDVIKSNGYEPSFVNAESNGILLNNYYFVFCRKIRQTF